jgi:hypothetical protein
MLSIGLLLLRLPGRYHLIPDPLVWVAFALGVCGMLAVGFMPSAPYVRRIERWTVIVLAVLATINNIFNLRLLVLDMIAAKHGIGSIELLESAAALWTINLVAFALLYWQLDHARRHRGAGVVVVHGRDFQFAEAEAGGSDDPGWSPFFVDYLFLAFVTSTSFTPPDYARPKSHPAKILLMLQASISLVTLFLIASRAIGTLS